MKNYVISLTTATNRREHIKAEFGKQNIHFEFFDAITPDSIERISTQLNIPLINNQRLSLGEKACFLSHVCLWQKMIDDDLKYIAIFEDDVYLGENADLFLNHDDWLQNIKADIIKLETWQELVHLHQHSINIHYRQFKQLKSTHVGAAAYIINQYSAKQAIEHLKCLPTDYLYAIDHVIFGALLDLLAIYQIYPALAIQADRQNQDYLVSQLEEERKNNTFIYQAQDGFLIRVKKLYQRFYRSIGKRTFYETVPFQ
ncbi:Lipooligosaccharide biosynthesis protein lex-1 [Moraxella lacunata]|uniref:Lipooligosaccharide biosynthesis protein lex-1 n=1 Tax=Moraxella lacunata TaxID=477 RepID=A0A378QFJ6_MORLA|nr:glycosyltransferase family 25 protein [Moraxella lacunata]STY99528.1 Lipooligosaccharide biosynthesis protein lex-1 [Moraxella lacunata]